MGQPYALLIRVLATPQFDPTLVTGATFKVTKPEPRNGEPIETVEWTAELTDQSAAGVSAVYNFAASGDDLNLAGRWRAWVQWTVPGQTPGPRSEVTTFSVADRDGG